MINRNWKDDFIHFQAGNNIVEAEKLKAHNFPTRFFKYRTLNDYAFDSIIRSQVFLTEAPNQNDPYECYFSVDLNEVARDQFNDPKFLIEFDKAFGFSFPNQYLHEILNSGRPFHQYIECCKRINVNMNVDPDIEIKKQERKRQEHIESERKNVTMCCFTTRHDSILMWSHYASHHRGICVEYDFELYSDIKALIQPVCYSDVQYDITNLLLPGYKTENILLGTYIAALTKAKDWEYEDEWRLIKNTKSTNHDVPKPTAIYLGTRFKDNEQSLKDRLFEIAIESNIPLVQMQLHSSKYAIVPQL